MKSTIQTLDLRMSKSIFDSFHSNKILSKTPYYLGLLPYEIYVLLGLYIAILQVIWLNNPNPIQYFILPYFFTSMIFYAIKTRFHRMRPGCYNKSMSKYMNEKYCSASEASKSFPSGHTGTAFALATALMMEMMYSEDSDKYSPEIKKIVIFIAFIVAIFVALHRVSNGYHHVGDVLAAAILGSIIGYISWTSMNVFKKKYYDLCLEHHSKEECSRKVAEFPNSGMLFGKIILTIIIFYLIYLFFAKDMWKMESL
jgi:membrane-associated phospholipid phosphatase